MKNWQKIAVAIPLLGMFFCVLTAQADVSNPWQSYGHGKREASTGEEKYQKRAEHNKSQQDSAKDGKHKEKEHKQDSKNRTVVEGKQKDSSHKQQAPHQSTNPPRNEHAKTQINTQINTQFKFDSRHEGNNDWSRHEHQPDRQHARDEDRQRHEQVREHSYKPRYWEGKPHRYEYARTPWYFTRFVAPIQKTFFRLNHIVNVLPAQHTRIVVRNQPYFYYSGVYYRPHARGYIVVSAPLGAVVRTLPLGFIAFGVSAGTYYYLNDVYYTWDDTQDGFVVVAKPSNAERAIAEATKGRLFIYPNHGQDEDQQAKDRYECHSWAVSESGIDPTLEDKEYTVAQNEDYRRALSACLEGRDYTVK